jgi:HSP20 family molecular chaperone IbpA
MGFGFEDFENAFQTMEGTTEEHIQASYENGILQVVVRDPEVQDTAKQIPVS